MLFNHFECLSTHGHNINSLSSRGQIDYFISRYNFHDITAQIVNRHVGISPIHLEYTITQRVYRNLANIRQICNTRCSITVISSHTSSGSAFVTALIDSQIDILRQAPFCLLYTSDAADEL